VQVTSASSFSIQLADLAHSIDDATVTSSTVQVKRGDTVLQDGTGYTSTTPEPRTSSNLRSWGRHLCRRDVHDHAERRASKIKDDAGTPEELPKTVFKIVVDSTEGDRAGQHRGQDQGPHGGHRQLGNQGLRRLGLDQRKCPGRVREVQRLHDHDDVPACTTPPHRLHALQVRPCRHGGYRQPLPRHEVRRRLYRLRQRRDGGRRNAPSRTPTRPGVPRPR